MQYQPSTIGIILGLLSAGLMTYFIATKQWKWVGILGIVNLGSVAYLMSQGYEVIG